MFICNNKNGQKILLLLCLLPPLIVFIPIRVSRLTKSVQMGDTFIVLWKHLWSQLVGYRSFVCILFNVLDIVGRFQQFRNWKSNLFHGCVQQLFWFSIKHSNKYEEITKCYFSRLISRLFGKRNCLIFICHVCHFELWQYWSRCFSLVIGLWTTSKKGMMLSKSW